MSDKKVKAREYCINRKGEEQDLVFKFGVGPKDGVCAHCGAEIKAYYNYSTDRNTGDMYCPECSDWAMRHFLMEHGFFHYTDG